MKLNPGDLRHRITIQTFTESSNDYNEPVKTWATFATVWASVSPLIGREYFASQQITAEVTGKIRMRYLEGVTPKMRVLFSGKIYDIAAVIDIEERHIEHVLMVKESQ
jgi:SPP1 family predicted phage head-tail adaptor